MAYLPSNKILVFPAVARDDAYQQKARLLTEESMARTLKLAHNNGNYVISTKDNVATDGLKFVIDGYYVEADFPSVVSTLSLANTDILYAKITLTTTNGYKELVGTDNNGEYQGVEFTKELPSSGVYIDILTMGANGVVKSINTPLIIDGNTSLIRVRRGTGDDIPSIKKGEMYLDCTTNTKALYLAIDDYNNTLKLEEQGNVSDVECNTIKVNGGVSGSSSVAQINGDVNSTSVTSPTINANNIGITGTMTATKSYGGAITTTTTIDGAGIKTNTVNVGTLTSDNNAINVTSGKGLTMAGSLSNSGTTTFNGATTVNNSLSATNGATITGNGLTVGNVTPKTAGNVHISGSYFANNMIVPVYSTTLPSDFSSASVLSNTRTYSGVVTQIPTGAPSTGILSDTFAILEVFNNGLYAIQRYTVMGIPASSGADVVSKTYQRIGHSVSSLWFLSAWKEV